MDRRTPLAAGLDTFAVVLFVAIGRREHERDSAIAGLIETAAPFLIALALAWLVLRVWKRPTEWRTGVGVWAIVVVVGMLLRNLVFDDGTATAFVIVATLFLALFIVGWRLAFAAMNRRHAVTPGT
jgi:FlaA1/EpsC-like NDP-sugar epimerase